jgi:hypothetical protein
MDTVALALMGAKYIAKLITGSKTFEGVKESTLQQSLTWIKTKVFGQRPQLQQAIEQTDGPAEKETILVGNLMELFQQESFKEEFLRWIEKEQEEPVVKSFLDANIKKLEGNITIGDQYNENGQQAQRPGQNRARVKIDEMKGDIRVGDSFGPDSK